LRSFVDQKETFKDRHRSRFNQRAFKEVKLGLFGAATTFGDLDSAKNRNYLYTMRAAKPNVKVWEIKADEFMLAIRSSGKDRQFKKWQKIQE